MENKSLPGKLKQLRSIAGLTQQQVADKIGVSRAAYAFYERGTSNPPLHTLTKIAEVFNLAVGELLDDENLDPEKRLLSKLINKTYDKKMVWTNYLNVDEKTKKERNKELIAVKHYLRQLGYMTDSQLVDAYYCKDSPLIFFVAKEIFDIFPSDSELSRYLFSGYIYFQDNIPEIRTGVIVGENVEEDIDRLIDIIKEDDFIKRQRLLDDIIAKL